MAAWSFQLDDTVRLSGLKSRPELNGALGSIAGPLIPASGRYPVRVGQETLLLKPVNLSLQQQTQSDATADPQHVHTAAAAVTDVSDPVHPSPAPGMEAKTDRGSQSERQPLPSLPTVPMWSPPIGVGGGAGFKWKPGGAEKLTPAEADEEDELADEFDGEEEEDDEDQGDDPDSQMAADAALLTAAALGAERQPGGVAAAAAAGFCATPTSSWRGAPWAHEDADQKEATPLRFMREVCGGHVQECDVSTPSGLEAATRAVRERVPIVLRGGAPHLLGRARDELHSLESLSRHLQGTPVSVLFAPPETSRRFTYYFDENAYDWNLMAPPPVNKRRTLEWGEGLVEALRGGGPPEEGAVPSSAAGTHYVQLSLGVRAGGPKDAMGANGATPLPMRCFAGRDSLLAPLQEAIRTPPMANLTSQLGPWQSSMLYVGPVGTLAPCHWDALDNLFTQLVGVKQVLLFSPDTKGMRPFPYNHPYDSRSQLDLESLSAEELSVIKGQGLLATLHADDILFIPNQWWHHIHAAKGGEDGTAEARLSLSVNCWFNPFEELAVVALPFPLKPHVHAQIARAVESLISQAAGQQQARKARAFSNLADLLAGRPLSTSVEDGKQAAGGNKQSPPSKRTQHAAREEEEAKMRNYVAAKLAAIYGRDGALAFVQTYLDPARWSALKGVCFKN